MHKTCVGPTRETTEANDITVYYKKLKKNEKKRRKDTGLRQQQKSNNETKERGDRDSPNNVSGDIFTEHAEITFPQQLHKTIHCCLF